jgi:plasmid maintenance system antidote protein VapI
MVWDTFGQFIRKAWLEKGLRQKHVARAIGVDRDDSLELVAVLRTVDGTPLAANGN